VEAQGPSLIHLPGKTIEVVGLDRWTVQMIQDSMDRYSPGDSLQSHACAVILRYKLHFADAAAQTYLPSPTHTGTYVLVSVVEPGDSARVRYRSVNVKFDTADVSSEWKPGAEVFLHHPDGFQVGISTYLTLDSSRRVPDYARRDSTGVIAMWEFLDRHHSLQDASSARRTLQNDPRMLDRIVAAAVLLNAASNDTTWWSLMEVLRESDGIAKETALQVLMALALNRPHRVDWTPEAGTIHAILDGTSLFTLQGVMDILVRTGVDKRWATPFLKGGGRAVLAHAGAHLAQAREPALRLLRALSGADLGTDVIAWRDWVRSL
jgi:hypothetical protein